jgi:hypothetical protein
MSTSGKSGGLQTSNPQELHFRSKHQNASFVTGERLFLSTFIGLGARVKALSSINPPPSTSRKTKAPAIIATFPRGPVIS